MKNYVFNKPVFWILLSVFSLAGCGTSSRALQNKDPRWQDPRISTRDAYFDVKTNALRNPDAIIPTYISGTDPVATLAAKKYYIASSLRDVSDSDLGFLEFAKYIENAIKAKAFTKNGATCKYNLLRTVNKEEADFVLTLAYGIGNPSTSSQTQLTSNGYGYWIGSIWFSTPAKTQTTTTTNYTRTLILEMHDAKKPSAPAIVKVTVTSTGYSDDLRAVMPYMVATSMPWSLEGTSIQSILRIYGHSPSILLVLFGE
jgi:hypothetical protein